METSTKTQDKIYKALYEADLHREGYTRKELLHATRCGWIKPSKIAPDGRTLKNVYLWLEDEMPQRGWFKRQLDKIRRLFTGDYSRYY